MPLEILPTHSPALFSAAALRATELLRAGEVVALPTETVYGLAANAFDPEAVRRIYEIKGRPSKNPIIVHVSSLEMAGACVTDWPESATRLARSFWPGPLTLVLPKSSLIPNIVTAEGPTVGIRWPSHPFIQEVIRRCGFPLAAPSANLANRVSPTNAGHVKNALGDRLQLIVDGGQAQVGIESTVIDLSTSPARILRPGMIHIESLRAVLLDTPVVSAQGNAADGERGGLRSPGLLPLHYAPKARLRVWSWESEPELLQQLEQSGVSPARTHVVAHSRIPSGTALASVSVIPHDAEAFARALYAELHRCDEERAELIVIEQPPDTPEWQAIIDRLRRASTKPL